MATKASPTGTLVVDANWSRGMLRDQPRTAMPPGTVYNAVDYLLDQPGLARKRGGSSYFGPTTGASVLESVATVELASGTSGSMVDSSQFAHAVTANGNAAVSQAQSKFGGWSCAFDGTGDYLSLADSADWAVGSGDFTIDFWVYFNSVATAQLFALQEASGSTDRAFRLLYAHTGLTLALSTDGTTYTALNYTAPWVPTTATWYHVAAVRTGNNAMLFVNGTQVGTTQAITGTVHDSAATFLIGIDNNASSNPMNGYIDEFRWSKGTAQWTANFTPPASEYTNPGTEVKLLLHFGKTTASTSQIAALASDNHLYAVTSGASTDKGSIGSTYILPLCKPVTFFAANPYVLFPSNDGTSSPKTYDGTSVAALGGSPPPGRIVSVFKQRPLLANSTANSSRLWFGPLTIGSAWDTANAYLDRDFPITGLAPVGSALLIFSSGRIDYLIGSVPPGTTGFDMAVTKLADIGCTDARSIGYWQNNVIFANGNGIYLTNGAGVKSITEPPEYGGDGIGTYWRSLLTSYDSSWQIHGGILGDFYIVTIRDNNDALVDTLMCYLPRRAWWRLGSSINAGFYATSAATGPFELYYADRSSGRVVALSGMLTPSASNKNDASGTAVTPVLETRFLGTGPTLKAYGFGRLSYDLRDAAADNPTLAVTLAPGGEATTFAAVPESPLAEVTDLTRKRITLNKDAQGVTLRLTQSNASSKTEIYALEVEERIYGETIDGQG